MVAVPLHAEPRRLTRSEYDRMVELGFFRDERLELIRGIVVRMPPIGPPHSDPVTRLTKWFVLALSERADVRTQQPFVACDESEPEPDVAIVPLGSYNKKHPSQAFMLVEVADSSLDYDRDTKAPLYASSGVPEYWIVNVITRAIEVYRRPLDGRYASVETYGAGTVVRPEAFPELEISVDALFA